MTISETIRLSADPKGLRELADIMESKYPGCKITYLSSYGTNMDVNFVLPKGTTIVLPQLIDATGTEEASE